ncbi:hypothetical protein GQ55_4G293200 [Panicum hallii var. hallii]|uniref:Uncharacterized protein n=1 Tax=Panicum hallii var. hallii TaxID=1504633 RepID=A0A2T7E1G1_9POAL|nr:hypothetical protein GQ55_4G293200 [Panicum hallii var. hallii]
MTGLASTANKMHRMMQSSSTSASVRSTCSKHTTTCAICGELL